MDFAAAGLLDGLEGEPRRAREALLEQLVADGASLEELKAAVAEDRLALLPLERLLGGCYSAAEIEAQTGVPAELIVRIRGLLGLPRPEPGDRVFGPEQITTASALKLFLDSGYDENAIAEITRVLGEGMSRLAATVTASFAETFLRPGDTEQEVAARFTALTEQLLPAAEPILVGAFRQHLLEAVRRGILGRSELEAGQIPDAQEIVVGFADLVGFTRLGGEVEMQELGSVAGDLAALAGEAVAPPVRLIKTIGDAAMFVSPEPGPLVDVTLSLLQAAQDAELPALRAGIASGGAVLRAGDYYGPSVNLAIRVTGLARPESVLCTEEVHDAVPEEFAWSFVGRRRLKGVGEPVALYRARPREDEPEGEVETGARRRPRRRRRER